MNAFGTIAALVAALGPVPFQRHDIDSFPGGYQVAVADVNRDGKPDVIALSTSADRVDWYENPGWTGRPVARTPRNIDLAPIDLDDDGRLELALASGFYFSESTRGGEIYLLREPESADGPWPKRLLAVDPVVHRLRWADLDGDGRRELIHAPIFGPGSDGARQPRGAHLWAFRVPEKPFEDNWEAWKIDETLTVLHGLSVADLDGDGRDEILTASFEGIFRLDFEGTPAEGRWRKTHLSRGAGPIDEKPGASRGSSEVAPGELGPGRPLIAAIEPWHGHQVVVYTPGPDGRGTRGHRPGTAAKQWSALVGGSWRRHVIDDQLNEGHALVVADFDGDGADEIVAGWRGGGGGLSFYDPVDEAGPTYKITPLDRGIAVEGAVAADLGGDGKLDLAVIAGRTNNLAWYENQTSSKDRR